MERVESKTTYYETRGEQKASKSNFPFFTKSLQNGLQAGGLIALFFFALQFFNLESMIGLKYVGYALLGIILAIALSNYDKYLKTGATFKKGMVYAAQISLFTGITLIGINLLAFLVDSSLVFSKYGLEATAFPDFLLVSGAMFFEVMVAGLVFTFIVLQYLKSRRDYHT